jgi:hypothetical protein
MNSDIGSDKFGEPFMPMGATRVTTEAIPGSTNLPAIPRAATLFGERKTNLFINTPPPANMEAVNEIDSREMRGVAASAPGTFAQPGTSSSSGSEDIGSPKMTKEKFIG